MTEIEKFLADLKKTIKFSRQQNNTLDYKAVRNNIRNLFSRTAGVPELAASVFEYWENSCIYTSSQEEPSEKSCLKLAAMLSFLKDDDEFQEELVQEDWNELGRLVNFESEDLDLDLLQNLMKILVSKGAY
ncbi:MAG: hypothetical protein K5829_02690 [Treponema sp.]|nr:hypothetical protein [Treponema sp.]